MLLNNFCQNGSEIRGANVKQIRFAMHTAVGNELYVLMTCTNPQVLEIRERFES